MYTKKDLAKYNFFDNHELNTVLDSLTGLINRQFILDFARHLISNNTPFAMGILDLDNFKNINDAYGHRNGDTCLQIVAQNLQECVGKDGLVGRFGGDEFIIIYLKACDYDSVYDFFKTFYINQGPLRKTITLEGNFVFITGTVGSASFPLDATTYDDLFAKMDKALYRGKSKGRNCFIVYVESKHKDIIVHERNDNSLLEQFIKIKHMMNNDDIFEITSNFVDYLYRTLHPYNIIYLKKDNYTFSGNSSKYYKNKDDLATVFKTVLRDSDIFISFEPAKTIKEFPITEPYIKSRNIHSFILLKVSEYGYIYFVY